MRELRAAAPTATPPFRSRARLVEFAICISFLSVNRDFADLVGHGEKSRFSPTAPILHLAPKGIRAIPQLYPFITIEIHAQLRIMIVGEFKPERLDSLPI